MGKADKVRLAAQAAGVAARRGKGDRATPVAHEPELGPTEAQQQRAEFELGNIVDRRPGGVSVTIGTAYRRTPMIETLGKQGVFSTSELKALRHYRHHADIADRSPTRDSLNQQRGGNGTGPTIEMLNAVRVTADCERAAGSLVDILRAVVVYDRSLSQWAMEHGGAIEECETRKGKEVCRPKPRDSALRLAKQDIQMAAKRVESELGA